MSTKYICFLGFSTNNCSNSFFFLYKTRLNSKLFRSLYCICSLVTDILIIYNYFSGNYRISTLMRVTETNLAWKIPRASVCYVWYIKRCYFRSSDLEKAFDLFLWFHTHTPSEKKEILLYRVSYPKFGLTLSSEIYIWAFNTKFVAAVGRLREKFNHQAETILTHFCKFFFPVQKTIFNFTCEFYNSKEGVELRAHYLIAHNTIGPIKTKTSLTFFHKHFLCFY